MGDKQKYHEYVLMRLVRDLETKTTLCYVNDYPGVELKQLNKHAKKLGPLVNPVFGEQPAFFIDEGHFCPYRMVVYGNMKVAAKIDRVLDTWATWSGEGGRVTTSQGVFILEQRPGGPNMWTYRGDPYVPTFVVEIDKLSNEGSQLSALDGKMRNGYFQHGVQLGWLIDPRPDFQRMYEYYLDDNGDVQCSDNSAWRDLDGGDVLPGFKMRAPVLEMVLNQDSGSSSEDEVDLLCPAPRCNRQFRSYGASAAHAEWHREERSISKYLAKRKNS
ncbi:putative restriction endonuclease [Phytophthora infestans]|uniref:Putative restriction endonuclease n=1 Tax=Phytophthora infestans TaxID=4787 RepID=A0A833SV64_PHYIN|nr:putative restriction endonuclease [Phytophthora infestans]